MVGEGDTTVGIATEAEKMRIRDKDEASVVKTFLQENGQEAGFADKTLTDQIQQLKEVQAEMKKAKKEAVKKLKNLQRQKKRLSVKARILSDDDLVQVLKLRRAKAVQSSAPSKSKSSHEFPSEDE